MVDLDLDGQPEVTFSGGNSEVAEGMEVVADEAADGRRAQWLVVSASAGGSVMDTRSDCLSSGQHCRVRAGAGS